MLKPWHSTSRNLCFLHGFLNHGVRRPLCYLSDGSNWFDSYRRDIVHVVDDNSKSDPTLLAPRHQWAGAD